MNSYSIYKARKEKNGCAASFQISEKGCFVTMAHQKNTDGDFASFDWTDANKKSKMLISLSVDEMGSVIATLDGKMEEFKAYHVKGGKKAETGAVPTTMSIRPYEKDGKKLGWGMAMFRGEEKYNIGINFGEAEIVKTILRLGIESCTVVQLKGKQE